MINLSLITYEQSLQENKKKQGSVQLTYPANIDRMIKDKEKFQYRIDGYAQLTLFFEKFVLQGQYRFTPHHISFYTFLLSKCNKARWPEWMKLPLDIGMQGSCIASRTTYYKILHQLDDWKLIEYHKGVADTYAPEIKLLDLRISLNGIHDDIHDDTNVDSFNITNNINNSVTNPINNSYTAFKKEVQSDEFIDNAVEKMKWDREDFKKHINEWIRRKELSRNIDYPIEKLREYILQDYKTRNNKQTQQTPTGLCR